MLELFQLSNLGNQENGLAAILALEVGENGKRLSGGQAKRICLIRSLVSKSDILIWDDPFSSVDLILEQKIISELKCSGLLTHKTIVLTSHRLSTVRVCDEVFYIGQGQGIIESGPMAHLIGKKSKFYEHFKQQMV